MPKKSQKEVDKEMSDDGEERGERRESREYNYNYIIIIRSSKKNYLRAKARALRLNFHHCELCGNLVSSRLIEVHHLDSDPTNNSLSNLRILCRFCHRSLNGREIYRVKAENIIPNLRDNKIQHARRNGFPVCEDCLKELTWDNYRFRFHRDGNCSNENRENLGFVCHDCAE